MTELEALQRIRTCAEALVDAMDAPAPYDRTLIGFYLADQLYTEKVREAKQQLQEALMAYERGSKREVLF